MESILTSVKKLLGISEEYDHFDPDIIMHINTVFATLTQLGVGPSKGFSITDSNTTWNDYIPENQSIESVKTYVYLKVKMVFDPPQSSIVMEALKRAADELEWRLNIAVDKATIDGETANSILVDWGKDK